LKPKRKTWRLLDTETSLKFSKGDEVRVTIYSKDPKFWYKGLILDINSRYVVPSVESSWKVEYYVSFENKKGKELRYWFLESELRKYDLQEERNSIIEQLLKEKRVK
jgi:hypothetical protein